MHEAIKAERFQTLLGNPRVLEFARQVITQSYLECAPGHEEAMSELLEQAFDALLAAKDDEARFQQAVACLVTDVFRKQDPDFWFNQVYKHYKREIKPPRRFHKLRDLIAGEKVLDLGCGDGLTSAILSQNGYRPHLMDVLDYRDEAARDLPFLQMQNPGVIPYPDDSFDAAMVMAVLHHVDAADLLPLLSELRRVSRQVIIEEDCYDDPRNLPGLEAALSADAHLAGFMALPVEDQLRYLMFIDYFANAITQGIPQMDMPFNFKTVTEWQALFEANGLSVQKTLFLGFQQGNFNRSFHVWFVLEKE